jgi:short-subunit dehydrogenase
VNFQQKVVWITGSSSGIGEALATHLYQKGAHLILSARREDELKRVQLALGGNAKRVHVLPLDLTQPDGFSSKAATALEMFGSIDIFLNSAGISQRSLVKDTLLSVDRQLMEVNYFGPVALTKAILPSMLMRKSGHIVIISSLVGKFGTPMRSGYAASKHALHGYFDSLRAEVRDEGIRVTLVCPGYINTDIILKSLTGDGQQYDKIDNVLIKGMPVTQCARIILRGIAAQKEEILVGGVETTGVYVHRLFPRIFARIVSSHNVQRITSRLSSFP